MKTKELTIAQERLIEHLDLCNEGLCAGHRLEKSSLFIFQVGELVSTLDAYPGNITGIVHGYIYSPFTASYRAVLGVNCDVEIDNLRKPERAEEIAFNLHTVSLNPVESRLSAMYS